MPLKIMPKNKPSSKFIILDRDGTIIEDRGYIHKIKDMKFLPGAVRGLKKLQNAGFRFIIITNQAGLARGIYNHAQFNIFNQELIKRLGTKNIKIEKTYYCPHHPEFTRSCRCRKPKKGMVLQAAKEFGFNISKCVYIGDKDSDMELGKNCKGITVLIENSQYPNRIQPDYKAKNLYHAFKVLAKTRVI